MWVCKPIFSSNLTLVKLCCLRLEVSWGCDNKTFGETNFSINPPKWIGLACLHINHEAVFF